MGNVGILIEVVRRAVVRDRVERRPERVADTVVNVLLDVSENCGERHFAARVVSEGVIVPRIGLVILRLCQLSVFTHRLFSAVRDPIIPKLQSFRFASG